MGLFDSPIFAVLNPVGFIAQKVQNNNGGDANARVSAYMAKTPAIPGCKAGAECTFKGTAADWEAYRRDFVNNCTADNTSGFGTSKNKTRAACQSAFDKATYNVRLQYNQKNVEEQNYIKSLIANDNTAMYIGGFLFVGLIIYLLTSKK